MEPVDRAEMVPLSVPVEPEPVVAAAVEPAATTSVIGI